MALALRRAIPHVGRNLNNQLRLAIRTKSPVRTLRTPNGDCLLPQIHSDWSKILPASLGISKRIAQVNLTFDACLMLLITPFVGLFIFNPDLPQKDRIPLAQTMFIDLPINLIGTTVVNTLNSFVTLCVIGMGIVAIKNSPRFGLQYLKRYTSLKQINKMNNGCQIADYTASGPFWKYILFALTIANTPYQIYEYCNSDDTSKNDISVILCDEDDNDCVAITGIDVDDE